MQQLKKQSFVYLWPLYAFFLKNLFDPVFQLNLCLVIFWILDENIWIAKEIRG